MQTVIQQAVDASDMDAQGAQALQIFNQLAGPIARRPWVLFWSGIQYPDNFSRGDDFTPRLALLVEVGQGDDAAILRRSWRQFNQHLAEEGALNEDVFPYDAHGLLGWTTSQTILSQANHNSLRAQPRFRQALGQTVDQPSLFVYADAQAIWQEVKTGMQVNDALDELQQTENVVKNLGLDTLGRVVWAAGFHDRLWRSSTWIEAPAPRRGLLKALNQAREPLPANPCPPTLWP